MLDALMDWMTKPDNFPEFFLRFSLVAGGFSAVVLAPFVLRAKFNENASNKILKELDRNPTIIFNAAAAADPRYLDIYERSKKVAMKEANKLGLEVTYSSEETCKKYHKDYSERSSTRTTLITVGKTTVPVTTRRTYYEPEIVGWQTAKYDPDMSVPLYSGLQDNTGVRRDGKTFDLPARTLSPA